MKNEEISLLKMAAKAEGIDFINQDLIKKAHEYANKSVYEQNTGIKQSELDYFWNARLFFNNL